MQVTDLLDRLTGVQEESDGWLAVCPHHADSHPSLKVSVGRTGKTLLKCRAGCATADVLADVGLTLADLSTMQADDVPTARRTRSGQDPAGPADIAALAVRLDEYAAVFNDAEPTHTYAWERFGIGFNEGEWLGLGHAEDLPDGPRLVVPFRDRDGVARGFQARALNPDARARWVGPKSPKGGAWSKLGYFEGGNGWDEVLVTEGPGDALTAVGAGYDAISIAGASHADNPQVAADVAAMVGDRVAVIAGDGDPAGRQFSARLADALAKLDVRVRVLNLADGLDLTDWRAQNPAAFPQQLIRAVVQAETLRTTQAAMLAWDETRYALSDLGGARFLRDFIESQGSGVKYTEEVGFMLLDGGTWRKDEKQAVRTHAQSVADLVRKLAREATEIAELPGALDAEVQRAARLRGYSRHVQSSRGLDSLLRELQAVKGVPAALEEFDQHPNLLACMNGVIDLRTGTLRPHDPNLLLTRRIGVAYDRDAKAPRWESFLGEVFPAYPTLPAYVRRLIGYGITGHTTEQCFAILWGTGANGKSVFTDTLTAVFREVTTTTPFSTFEDRPSGGIPNDLAALKGSRLVMASEGDAGRRMAEATLKRVTGRDMIAARFMRKEFFEFRPTFLLFLASNNKPEFRGQDEGLWRRVKFIPWERYFAPAERDHKLGDNLLQETQGILAWAVRGAQEWFASGLQDPDTVVAATKDYRETSDVLEGFLPGVFVADANARLERTVVFHAFQEYAQEGNYLDLMKWSSRALYRALEERGFGSSKSNGKQYVSGLRRARRTDERAEDDAPAPSISSKPLTRAITGADLDDVL